MKLFGNIKSYITLNIISFLANLKLLSLFLYVAYDFIFHLFIPKPNFLNYANSTKIFVLMEFIFYLLIFLTPIEAYIKQTELFGTKKFWLENLLNKIPNWIFVFGLITALLSTVLYILAPPIGKY